MRPRAIPGVANLADAIAAETVDFGSAILPAQHFASAREQRLMEAEHRLLLAVLEDAVRCYLSYARPRNQLQRIKLAEVRNWFSPPDGVVQEGLFTFASICEFLGIEPKLFLSRLEAINISNLPPMRRQCARRLSLAEQSGARRRREVGPGTFALRTTSWGRQLLDVFSEAMKERRYTKKKSRLP